MKLFVAHKKTRNNTMNKEHVAATELLYSAVAEYKCMYVWRGNRTKSLSEFEQLQSELKNKLL